ncbi:hypothetical protein CPB85DRAFT_851377, partial [Mucidula mucida]
AKGLNLGLKSQPSPQQPRSSISVLSYTFISTIMRKPVNPDRYVFGFRLNDAHLLKRGRELNLGPETTEWEAAVLAEETARSAYVLPTREFDIRAELYAVKRTPQPNDGKRPGRYSAWLLALGSNVPGRKFEPPSKEKIQEVMEHFGFTKPPRWAEIY